MISLPTRTGHRSLVVTSGFGHSQCSVEVASLLVMVFTGQLTAPRTTRRMDLLVPIVATSSQLTMVCPQHVLKTATLAHRGPLVKTLAASNKMFRWRKGMVRATWLPTSLPTPPSRGSMRSSSSSRCTNNIRIRCRTPMHAQISTLRSWRTKLEQPSWRIKLIVKRPTSSKPNPRTRRELAWPWVINSPYQRSVERE